MVVVVVGAMGCDIHGTIEVKQSDLGGGDGLWYAVAKLDLLLGRSYEHFAHLFGVRVYADQQNIRARGHPDGMTPKRLYEGRGMPHDVSDTTKREYEEWGRDAHSETWAYQHEIESAIEGTELGERDGSLVDGWVTAVNIGTQIADLYGESDYLDGTVRWVVWFDN